MPKWLDPIGWWKRRWAWFLEYQQAPAADPPSPAGCRYADGQAAAAGDTVVGHRGSPGCRLPVAGVVVRLYPHDGQITVAYLRLRPLRFLAGMTVAVVDLSRDNPIAGPRLVGMVTRAETFLAKDFRKIDAAAELEKH